jgi:hypothetical protein
MLAALFLLHAAAVFYTLTTLIAQNITELQHLIMVCEIQLVQLDMQINVNKSMCIRFGGINVITIGLKLSL